MAQTAESVLDIAKAFLAKAGLTLFIVDGVVYNGQEKSWVVTVRANVFMAPKKVIVDDASGQVRSYGPA
jgi:hypothetical protein